MFIWGVIGRRTNQSRQERALRQRQSPGRLSKIHFRRGLDAVSALAEVDLVEVAFQDLILGQTPLNLHGQQHLRDLAAESLLVREEEIAGKLLGNRAAALGKSLLAYVSE